MPLSLLIILGFPIIMGSILAVGLSDFSLHGYFAERQKAVAQRKQLRIETATQKKQLALESKQLKAIEQKRAEDIENGVITGTSLASDLAVFDKQRLGLDKTVTSRIWQKLESISENLRDLCVFYGDSNIPVETAMLLHSAITDYLPKPLESFKRLPEAHRAQHSVMEASLYNQCEMLLEGIVASAESAYKETQQELKANELFIETKFAKGKPSSLTLGKE